MNSMKNYFFSLIVLTLTLVGTFTLSSASEANEWAEVNQEYIQHLNRNYPGLNVKTQWQGQTVFDQLEMLEGELQGDFQLPTGNLDVLSCRVPACGGSGGGGCPTCLH